MLKKSYKNIMNWSIDIFLFLIFHKIYSSHVCFVSICFDRFLTKSVEIRALFSLLQKAKET